MDNRKYNIYFNTHTVSGIIICAILYVMFFAGSFTFFKEDIAAWQKNDSNTAHTAPINRSFNYLIDSLGQKHALKGRDFDFKVLHNHSSVYVTMTASHDTTVKKKPDTTAAAQGGGRGRRGDVTASGDTATKNLKAGARYAGNKEIKAADEKDEKKKGRGGRGRRGGDDDSAFFTYNFRNQTEVDYASSYTMGEFLYRLHFLAQVNSVLPFRIGVPFGYLLAGIVSFIFLFALITGLLLHWDKLVSNFFTFRPWNKWKNVWTELHTVLGVIGFPYQLVFAVTGIVLIFNSFLIVPYSQLFYKGKNGQEKIFKDLGIGIKQEFAYTYQPLNQKVNVDSLIAIVENKWQHSDLSFVAIRNYGDANMHVVLQGTPHMSAQMNGMGEWIYRVRDQKVISDRAPLSDNSYLSTFKGLIYRLHFGDFGGRPLRVMYFVLGILGCVIINSGVMIWLVARDKTKIPERKRKFNFWVANVYLSSSLSLLPVTAFTMIALLFLKQPEQLDIYHWFFYPWLILGVYLLVLRNLDRVNRQTTLLSAILCVLLPVMHGIVRGNWIWVTYQRGALDILFIDVLFLVLGVISAVIYWKMAAKHKDAPVKAAAPAPRPKAKQAEAIAE